MQAFFSKVPEQYLDSDEYFYDDNGDAFYYKLTISEETFTIEDTVGRFVPFDFTDAKELSTAVFIANSVYQAKDEAEKLFKQRMDRLDQLVDHFNGND